MPDFGHFRTSIGLLCCLWNRTTDHKLYKGLKSKSFQMSIKWNIIWIFFHSISLLLIGKALDFYSVNNELSYLILTGLGVTVIAKILRIFTRKAKFVVNADLFFWVVVNTITIWAGGIFLNALNVTGYLTSIILTAFFLVVVATISRRMRLRKKERMMAAVVFGLLLIFANSSAIPELENAKADTIAKLSSFKENLASLEFDMDYEYDDSGNSPFQNIFNDPLASKEESKEVFNYINVIRQQNGRRTIQWDDQIYNLARWKAEDMTERRYFDHVDPDGKCVGSYARNFGLTYPSDSYAENIFGYNSPTWFDQEEAVASWMTSRGHRYNLLYQSHSRGAIACDSQNCVFIGQGGSGWSCATGAAGLAFWDSVGRQPGEL